MHGLFFYIGLGLGLALACGLRPYLPTLLAGGLASAGALGVAFGGRFDFLQSGWWLLAVGLVLAGTYVVQLGLAHERFETLAEPMIWAHAVAAGALLFAGTLAAHGDAWWPGIVAGAAAAALVRAAVAPIVTGARSRLADRTAREGLSVYLDGASLALAALVALLYPLGYIAAGLALLLLARVRSRAAARPGGLRIVRR